MILSGNDVKAYIEAHKLVINPIQGNQFQQNGVDLILDSVDRDAPEGQKPPFVGAIWMGAFSFVLGRTREYLEMPNDVMAFVQLRSTWARKGFILPPTVVDAGFKGTITLEILSCKHQTVPIGQRFAHLIFAKMTGPSIPYNGKYQGQIGITQAIDDSE